MIIKMMKIMRLELIVQYFEIYYKNKYESKLKEIR
jgi:hypothetical protein